MVMQVQKIGFRRWLFTTGF